MVIFMKKFKINVNGKSYDVEVEEVGVVSTIKEAAPAPAPVKPTPQPAAALVRGPSTMWSALSRLILLASVKGLSLRSCMILTDRATRCAKQAMNTVP